jgi:hypothetical protein
MPEASPVRFIAGSTLTRNGIASGYWLASPASLSGRQGVPVIS